MKRNFMLMIFILGIVVVSGCTIESAKPKPGSKDLIVGGVIDTDIQSPHPYSNSDGESKLIWSYTLSHPNSTNLKLHFKKIEVKSYHKQINKGETEVRVIIPSNGIDLDYPNNMDVFPEDMEKVLSTWVGDYVIIRDSNRKIVAIVGGTCPHGDLGYEDQCFGDEGFWLLEPVNGDTAIIELYADEKENGYGLHIDKYSRGFTEEERELVNQQRLEQYYQDCEQRSIPRNECPIPK